MHVSGVSFGKNVIKYDYPIEEAIRSIMPVCDEVIVAVGKSEDQSLSLIESIDPDKVRIIETEWDEKLREGGAVLAYETNKALKEVASKSDWIFYIQGDEVVHEKYLPVIKEAMLRYKDDDKVDGLLFNYFHFYGSYNLIANSYDWYRREIRIIKNNRDIYSYRDAQGFRKKGNKKLNVKHIEAWINHYGWVKNPIIQQEKQKSFQKLWHKEDDLDKRVDQKQESYDYSEIDSLIEHLDSHPKVMQKRISMQDWDFDISGKKIHLSFKNKCKKLFERLTGIQIGEYKNYKII